MLAVKIGLIFSDPKTMFLTTPPVASLSTFYYTDHMLPDFLTKYLLFLNSFLASIPLLEQKNQRSEFLK